MTTRICSTILLFLTLACVTSPTPADDRTETVSWKSAQVESALARAGENATQIQAALEHVSPSALEGMVFLVTNMSDRDLKQLSSELLLDNVRYAYQAWSEVPWKESIPKDVFLNNVLPYASVDERRDNWRKDLYDRFKPIVQDQQSPGKAAALLNQQVFRALDVRYSTKRPKANQSPYESIDAKMASCTGLSLILIDACRAVGIPARFVGTPLWSDRSGNHSWVEVWDDGWHFTGAAEPDGDQLDRGWFIGRASKALRDDPRHAIYAVSFQRTPLTFPMVWSRRDRTVYAVNVTDRYTPKQTELPAGSAEVMVRVFDRPGGERKTVTIRVSGPENHVLFEGQTNDERFDANDHITMVLPHGRSYDVALRLEGLVKNQTIQVTENGQLFTFYLSD